MSRTDEIKRKAAMVESKYGKTTKGAAKTPKPSTNVKLTGSFKKPDIKVVSKW